MPDISSEDTRQGQRLLQENQQGLTLKTSRLIFLWPPKQEKKAAYLLVLQKNSENEEQQQISAKNHQNEDQAKDKPNDKVVEELASSRKCQKHQTE